MDKPQESVAQFESITSDVSGVIEIRCCAISDILKEHDIISEKTRTHIIRWFLNPDIGSPFDSKTKIFRNRIPKKWILPIMRWLGYDGIIVLYGKHIIGHAFFQKHKKKTGSELHLFSIAVTENLRGRGIGTRIGQTFVEFGRKPEKQIEKLRIGGGGDSTVRTIFNKIVAQAGELGITADESFFINFGDRNERPVDLTVKPKKPVGV